MRRTKSSDSSDDGVQQYNMQENTLVIGGLCKINSITKIGAKKIEKKQPLRKKPGPKKNQPQVGNVNEIRGIRAGAVATPTKKSKGIKEKESVDDNRHTN